jgi:uncharacterized OsmC-like protein
VRSDQLDRIHDVVGHHIDDRPIEAADSLRPGAIAWLNRLVEMLRVFSTTRPDVALWHATDHQASRLRGRLMRASRQKRMRRDLVRTVAPGQNDPVQFGTGRRGVAVDQFAVVVGAGSCRSVHTDAVRFPHRWTSEGVTVETDFTGAHLLHLAAAGCVLNDIYREAGKLGIRIDGVRVTASGGFDTANRASTGITYRVELHSPASAEEQARLLDRVDEVAEIPRAIRAGATVQRS